MPQYVSLRLWLPDNAPSALVDVLAQTPTHISRPSPKTPYCAHCPTPLLGVRQLSHVLYCPAPAHGNSTTCAFPSAEVPAPQIPTAPVELCIPTHPKLQRGHRPNDGRNTRFQRARIALCSRIVPSTDQVVLLKNTSLFSLREYLSWRYKISTTSRTTTTFSFCQFQPHLLLAVPTTATCSVHFVCLPQLILRQFSIHNDDGSLPSSPLSPRFASPRCISRHPPPLPPLE